MRSNYRIPKTCFDVVKYIGSGSSIPDDSLGSSLRISGLSLSPDLLWIKDLNETGRNHNIIDSIRGKSSILLLDSSREEVTNSDDAFISFNSDGFTVGRNALGTQSLELNNYQGDYVAYCWDAGDTSVTNNKGTITSQVKSNGIFSVVKYQGTSTANTTVGHGLDGEVDFLICKRVDDGADWYVYHKSLGLDKFMSLNSLEAETIVSGYWSGINDTTFGVGPSTAGPNVGSQIAYAWSEIPGYSKFGKFTHQGVNAKLDLGFKPAWIMIKQTNATSNWYVFDKERSTNNALFADTGDIETGGWAVTFNYDGISWLSGSFTAGDYIYAAFADIPQSSKNEVTIEVSDDTNLDQFKVGDTVTGIDGVVGLLVEKSGTTLTINTDGYSDWTSTGTVDAVGGGVGVVSDIDETNGNISITNVSNKFIPGGVNKSQNLRTGALAVSDVVDNVSLVSETPLNLPSLRFNSADEDKLSRTPFIESNRKTWTWSGWVKRSGITSDANLLFSAWENASNRGYIQFQANTDKILVFSRVNGTDIYEYSTDAVFRDISNFYHIVVAFDTTQSNESDRIKIYVNGVEQSLTAGTVISQNTETFLNTASPHYIGSDGSSQYFDGYLAQVNFIDGKAIKPSEFAKDNNGFWEPKTYVGGYGINGFYLDFVGGIGTDDSGNGNNWYEGNLVETTTSLQSSTITNVSISGNNEILSFTDNTNLVEFKPSNVLQRPSVFEVTTYSGANGSSKQINNGLDLEGSGGLVWIKNTSSVDSHSLQDTENGVLTWLATNSAAGNTPDSDRVTSFNSNGFTLGTNDSVNGDDSYVAWTFRQAPNFFDIVKYTGSVGSNTVVPHSLGVQPSFMLFTTITTSGSWWTFHRSLSVSGSPWWRSYIALNETNPAFPNGNYFYQEPDNQNIYIQNGYALNDNTDYVAYLFADKPGVIKCGTYVGNNGSQEVDCGFKPKWLMFKNATSITNWIMVDIERGWQEKDASSSDAPTLTANLDLAQPNNSGRVFWTDNGFYFSSEGNIDYNTSGETYIFIAIAESASSEIEVVSVDEFNNQMTVNGGDWLGSDGSGTVGGDTTATREQVIGDTSVDSPVYGNEEDTGLGGQVLSNYATLNPLAMKGVATFANGNLQMTMGGSDSNGFVGLTINPTSGKYYFEWNVEMSPGQGDGQVGVGIVGKYDYSVGNPAGNSYPSTFCGFFPRLDMYSVLEGSETGESTPEPSVNYKLGTVVDYDNSTITLWLNGTQGNTVSFSSVDTPLLYINWGNNSNTANYNFGQQRFIYPVPEGCKTLNANNI